MNAYHRRLDCLVNCSGTDQRNIKAPPHWILWGESPHKVSLTREMFPVDDVIMTLFFLRRQSISIDDIMLIFLIYSSLNI